MLQECCAGTLGADRDRRKRSRPAFPHAWHPGAKGRAAGTARSHVMPWGRCFAHRPQAAMMKPQPCLPSQEGLRRRQPGDPESPRALQRGWVHSGIAAPARGTSPSPQQGIPLLLTVPTCCCTLCPALHPARPALYGRLFPVPTSTISPGAGRL